MCVCVCVRSKSGFTKKEPKIFTYRDYKRYDPDAFRFDLSNYISPDRLLSGDNDAFDNAIPAILNKHAPMKKSSSVQMKGPL